MRSLASTGELCPEPESFGPVESFLGHLEDLRWMLLRCLFALLIGTALCLSIADDITALLLAPLESIRANPGSLNVPQIEQRGPGTAFMVAMQAGLYGDIAVALPILSLVVGSYLMPAPRMIERQVLLQVMTFGTLMFLLGPIASHHYLVPLVLRASLQFSAWLGLSSTMWFIDDYAAMVMRLIISLGLAAEVPVLLRGMIRLGVVSVAGLARARPYAVIANLVVAAIITPTDIGSCQLLATPLHALFEGSLPIGRLVEQRQKGGAAD